MLLRERGGRTGPAVVLPLLARAECSLGRRDRAREHLREALRTAVEMGNFLPLEPGLPAVALLLADEGKVERAVEVYALASRYP